jgi:hypothetical protein
MQKKTKQFKSTNLTLTKKSELISSLLRKQAYQAENST